MQPSQSHISTSFLQACFYMQPYHIRIYMQPSHSRILTTFSQSYIYVQPSHSRVFTYMLQVYNVWIVVSNLFVYNVKKHFRLTDRITKFLLSISPLTVLCCNAFCNKPAKCSKYVLNAL